METPVRLAQHVADDQPAAGREVAHGVAQQLALALGRKIVEHVEQGHVTAHGLDRGRVGRAQFDPALEAGLACGGGAGGDLARVVVEAEIALQRAAGVQIVGEQADPAAEVEQGQGGCGDAQGKLASDPVYAAMRWATAA